MTANHRRLYRSKTDSMLFGVAGGMAEYFDIDPTLMRAAWVVLIVASAGAALALPARLPFAPLPAFAVFVDFEDFVDFAALTLFAPPAAAWGFTEPPSEASGCFDARRAAARCALPAVPADFFAAVEHVVAVVGGGGHAGVHR